MSIANEIPVGGAGSSPDQGRDLKQAAHDVKDAVVEKAAEVRDRASALYETGKEKASAMYDAGKEKASSLYDAGKEKAHAYYEQGKATASEYLHEGADRAKDFERQVEGYIRQKPIQSVLIAVGVGVVLGALLKR